MKEILDNMKLRPKVCVWELTAACNMRCLHCGSDLESKRKHGEELTLEESLQLCEELYALGCEEVTLSGGEPLLSSKWQPVAQMLSNWGIRVALISNGFLVDRATAHRIKDVGIGLVGLSLDGTESTHNYVRCQPQSFGRVREAIAHCKNADLEVCLVTTINSMNVAQLPDIEDFAASNGVDVWQLQLGAFLGRMAQHPELLLQPCDLPAVADFILAAKRRRKVMLAVADSIGYHSEHERELRHTGASGEFGFWCGCTAGCLLVGIEHNGNVLGCLSLQADRFVEGNVRNEALATIWQKKGNFAYTRDFSVKKLHGHCQGCEFGEVCRGGCTAIAYGATGMPHDNPYCLHRVLSSAGSVA